MRARNTIYENLNEECEARKLPDGIKTRSVAADCKGRCGIAKSTIASGGDEVYALGKRIKQGIRLMKYEGTILKTKADVLEASRSSNFVLEFGTLLLILRTRGRALQGSSMTLWTNSCGTVNSKYLRERYGSSPHKTLSLTMNFLSPMDGTAGGAEDSRLGNQLGVNVHGPITRYQINSTMFFPSTAIRRGKSARQRTWRRRQRRRAPRKNELLNMQTCGTTSLSEVIKPLAAHTLRDTRPR